SKQYRIECWKKKFYELDGVVSECLLLEVSKLVKENQKNAWL
ncbi:7232_t:CDS:1, partial [Entrophospora sp. SA101]